MAWYLVKHRDNFTFPYPSDLITVGEEDTCNIDPGV